MARQSSTAGASILPVTNIGMAASRSELLRPAFGEPSPSLGPFVVNPHTCSYRWSNNLHPLYIDHELNSCTSIGLVWVVHSRWWQKFLIVLVLYTAWASPFELAMEKSASAALAVTELVVDAFFAVDIAVSFFVAYRDASTGLLVTDRKKIATRYTWCWSVTACPFFFLFAALSVSGCKMFLL